MKEEKKMADKNKMGEEQLNKVNGGFGEYGEGPHFKVGDLVMLALYPEYGVGEVKVVSRKDSSWECVVAFGSDMVTADQSEFTYAS